MLETMKAPDKLNDRATERRDDSPEAGHVTKEPVQDKLHDMADRASEKYGAGKEKLQALEQSFVGKVHESPLKSLMIAAGVGLLVGILWRRA